MAKDDLVARTRAFALRVIRLVRALPKTIEARAVGAQLVRCGTSVGANYRAARRSRSRKEFIARLGVVDEETDESCYWLELIIESDMLPANKVQPLHDEARELSAIFVQSLKPSRKRPG